MSETWERNNKSLKEIIDLQDFEIVSKVCQRKGGGGRSAVFVNKLKFEVKDLTNTVIQVPWGVEAVWCLLTPKNRLPGSEVKKIACCALYVKPGSRKKTILLDHVAEAYNVLCTKYGQNLDFILAGDTNGLKLAPILSLDQRMTQVVTKWTRNNPPAILDPIITTLSRFYQEPNYLEPLSVDPEKIGVDSDHRIIVCRPINQISSKSVNLSRQIKFRPFPGSGFEKMTVWMREQTWTEVFQCESAHDKAETFQNMLIEKLDEIFPEKVRTVKTNDQPWITHKLKQLDRKRKRIYNKEKKSIKWKLIDKQFKEECKNAKSQFYKKSLEELKSTQPRKWYSCLKKISSHDQKMRETPFVEEISNLSDQEQAEKIADQFAKIQNEYDQLADNDIILPTFSESEIPFFSPAKVWLMLTKLDVNKSTVPGDFPAKLSKHFAAYLAEPFADIVNTSVRRGEYPNIYKFELCTPVPKVYPTEKVSQLRNISGLFHFDKIMEKLLAELIVADMENSLDPSQFGNQRNMSIQHYLVTMLHRILGVLDKTTKKEKKAILVSLIDWDNAFPRLCPKLGVQSFIKNGVRASLIPVLKNFFQGRKMSVKWHNHKSVPRQVNGGGPQGATLGLLDYTSQSNDCANFVPEEDRFRFIDDLSILEVINLLTIGLASKNLKQHIPSNIATHNQFIPAENLKSQEYLKQINDWTVDNKMKINERKTKNMIFNFSRKYQFNAQLELNGQEIETVNQTKLLGTIFSSDLKWDLNTAEIVRKANMRMELLRRVAAFNPPIEDLKIVYFSFIRSLLEQSAVVWHSSLTEENCKDLERVQRSAMKIILGERFISYKKSLDILGIQTLKDRRKELCLRFAKKSLRNSKLKNMFPLNEKQHKLLTRKPEKYKVEYARHERLKKSPIIYMQKLLNEDKS